MMSKKDEELLNMIRTFTSLDENEQRFVFGLAEGLSLCKSHPKSDQEKANELLNAYKRGVI